MRDSFDKNNELSTESKQYLNQYGDTLKSQSEFISAEEDINSNAELEEFLEVLHTDSKEYLVEYALLTCSQCKSDKQLLKHNNEEIESIFLEEYNTKRIHVLEERTEKIGAML